MAYQFYIYDNVPGAENFPMRTSYCATVKSTKFWDFVAGRDNVPDVWFLPKQSCSTHFILQISNLGSW